MTKNMTQKGLALGAASALLISGFVALPASGAGQVDKSFVSLSPNTGTEYTVLADNFFDLKATMASTIAGQGNIKFLVADTAAVLSFDVDVNGAAADATTNVAITNGAGFVMPTSTGATVTEANPAVITFAVGVPNILAVGDTIQMTNVDAGTPTVGTVTGVAGNVVTTDIDTSGAGTTTVDQAGDLERISSQASTTLYTIHTAATNTLVVGDSVTLAQFVDINGGVGGDPLNVTQVVTAVTANSFSFTLATPATAAAVASDNVTAAGDFDRVESTVLATRALMNNGGNIGNFSLIGSTPVVQSAQFAAPVNGRKSATDGTFVVDTNVNAVANDQVLRLANTGLTTVSVVVTAWVDGNDNGLIDTTEFTSPERTVTFQARSTITAAATTSPVIGDATYTATVATTPVLNGNQVQAQDVNWLNVSFTRAGNTAALFAAATAGAGANQTAVWNDTTKLWTAITQFDADLTTAGTTAETGAAAGTGWATLTAPIAANSTGISVNTTGLVTVTTAAAHFLATGDTVTMAINAAVDTTITIAAEATARTVTALSATTFTYQVTETTGFPAAVTADTTLDAATEYTLTTYAGPQGLVDRAFAGSYIVRPIVETVNGAAAGAATWVFAGAASTQGTVAVTTTGATLATTASAGVAGVSAVTNAANTAIIAVGTTSVPMTLSATSGAGATLAGVTANRPVVITAGALFGGGAASGAFLIDGAASPVTLRTDATGSVSFTVTTTTAIASAQTGITAVVEGTVTRNIDLNWNAVAFGMTDMNTTGGQFAPATNVAVAKGVVSGGSHTMKVLVSDQFFNAGADGTYRLQVTGTGVTNQNLSLVDGMAEVVITDSGLNAVGGNFVSVITLQLANAAGVFAATTSILTVTTTVMAAPSVTLASVGQTQLSPGGNAAVLSSPTAAVALVENDTRSFTGVLPAYVNNNLVSGSVISSTNSAAQGFVKVTVSGPTNMLFRNGTVDKIGSIDVLTNAAGLFEVSVFSTTAQAATVLTVTANGVSSTVNVTFTGVGIGNGTALTVTMPAAAKPGSTFQVKVALKDAFGNSVTSAAAAMRVTYTGAGLVFGTLPTVTDANGEINFSVLLGSNDTGTASVTASYDQNGDADFIDTLDLTATGSTEVTASGKAAAEVPSSTDTVVNVGSFNGKLVVYANKAAGAKISYKIAGKWVVQNPTAGTLQRYDRVVAAKGVTVKVDIYVDGVKKLSKSVVTR